MRKRRMRATVATGAVFAAAMTVAAIGPSAASEDGTPGEDPETVVFEAYEGSPDDQIERAATPARAPGSHQGEIVSR